MKPFKFLAAFLLCAAVFFSSTALSQNKTLNLKPLGTSGTAKTTLSDTDTAFLASGNVGAHQAASFVFVQDKLTGTVAGSAILQVSNDGMEWMTIKKDTLTFANVAKNQIVWDVSPFNFRHARVRVYTSGTQSSKPKCSAYFIKPQ